MELAPSEGTPLSPHRQARNLKLPDPVTTRGCCFGGIPSQLSEYSSYKLFDSKTRRPVVLGALWADAPVVIVFLRRLGCQLCRLRASEFEAARPAIAQAGASVVCVTFEFVGEGSDVDLSWSLVGCWTGAMLTDPTRVLYRQLFRRKGLCDGFFGLLDLDRKRVAESVARGLHTDSNLRGDGLMLGGVFVVGRGGSVLLDQRSRHFGDDVPVSVVLNVLRTAGSAGGVPRSPGLSPSSATWSRTWERPLPDCARPSCMLEHAPSVSCTTEPSRAIQIPVPAVLPPPSLSTPLLPVPLCASAICFEA